MRRLLFVLVVAVVLTDSDCASVLCGGVNLLSGQRNVERIADIPFDSKHALALDVVLTPTSTPRRP
ncbi:MAG: hypothetical protein WCE70_11280 [Rhodanobacteraceae bacterium]